MSTIVFHTNLDEAKPDVFEMNRTAIGPSRVPCAGERVRFSFFRGPERFWFDLEVVGVVWEPADDRARVELHMPSWQASMSIREWSEWFARHRHGRA